MQRYSSQAESETQVSQGLTYESQKGNNFVALRKLKQADLQLDLMKRRLSALKIKEEKNTRKSESALKKLKFHQIIQEMQKRERERKEIHKAENQLRIERQKSMNSSERSYRKEKITQARQIFQEDRHLHYKAEKQISKSLAERLKVLNESDFSGKREMKGKIKDYQERSKRNYHLYLLQRQSAIKSHKQSQSSRLQEMQERKQLEMRNLARLELQMLERQSKSRESAENSVRQLSEVINPLARSKIAPSKVKNPEQLQRFP